VGNGEDNVMDLYSEYRVSDVLRTNMVHVYPCFYIDDVENRWLCLAPLGEALSVRSPEELVWRPAPGTAGFDDVVSGRVDVRLMELIETPPFVGEFFVLNGADACRFLGSIDLSSFGTRAGTPEVVFSIEPEIRKDVWMALHGSMSPVAVEVNGHLVNLVADDLMQFALANSVSDIIDLRIRTYARELFAIVNGDVGAILYDRERGQPEPSNVRARPLTKDPPVTLVDSRGQDWDVMSDLLQPRAEILRLIAGVVSKQAQHP
jgi:hypothetical protein